MQKKTRVAFFKINEVIKISPTPPPVFLTWKVHLDPKEVSAVGSKIAVKTWETNV